MGTDRAGGISRCGLMSEDVPSRNERSGPSHHAQRLPEAREAALMWESAEEPMSAIGTSTTRSRAHGRLNQVGTLSREQPVSWEVSSPHLD